MCAVLFAGLLGMNFLISGREQPRTPPSLQTSFAVDTMVARSGNFRPQITVYGEIFPQSTVDLRALVSGQIIRVHPELKEGALLQEGTELLQIDPFSFEVALNEAIANRDETKARIAENQARIDIETSRIRSLKEQLELAQNDLRRITELRQRGTSTPKQVEDRAFIVSQRSQSLEQSELNLIAEKARLEQFNATLVRYNWKVTQAERNLADTILYAPFTGVVSQDNAAIGRIVNVNDPVVSLYDANKLEVRFTLTDQRFGRLQADKPGIVGRAVQVNWIVGNQKFKYPAVIDRISARIDSSKGGVEVIAILQSGFQSSPVRPGAFVEVIVPDSQFENHFRIPQSSLYGDETIYVVENGVLSARNIVIHANDGDFMIVSGELKQGEEVLLTRISEISDGLNVVVQQRFGTQTAGDSVSNE